MHRKSAEIDSLSAELTASRSEVLRLERDIGRMDRNLDTLSTELQRLQRYSSPEMLSLLDDSPLDSRESTGIDPYNSGSFDKSKSWRSRK